MSREWDRLPSEAPSRYTQINYQSCKNANDQSIANGDGPIPEWDHNNRARESTNGILGLLTGYFPDYAIEDDENEELNDVNAFLSQSEAIVLISAPPWLSPLPGGS
jgi:hypothetical protein